MAFDYNPQDKIDNGGKAPAGQYKFKVDSIEEVRFRTGSDGWKITMLVAALPDKDIKVFCNLVNSPKSLWKFEQFAAAFGFDFQSPPRGGYQPGQFEGRYGEAKFEQGEKGYLEVDEFIAASANTQSAPAQQRKSPPKMREPGEDDDAPPPHGDEDCPL